MEIRLNGEDRHFATPLTVRALLDVLDLDRSRVAVELNREVLKRELFERTELADGDLVEIVRFVGGG